VSYGFVGLFRLWVHIWVMICLPTLAEKLNGVLGLIKGLQKQALDKVGFVLKQKWPFRR